MQTALNTLVVTEQIVPLPVVRAQAMLNIAAALADQAERTTEQEETFSSALAAVREQVELAEILGYGDRKTFKPIYRQLKKIEESNQDIAAYADLQNLLKDSLS